MSDYEPREQSEAWIATVEAHNAAAFCCDEHENPVSGVRLCVSRDAARAAAYKAKMIWSEHSLFRNGVEVARWRAIQ